LHTSIVASEQSRAAFQDEFQQHFKRVQEQVNGSINEVLMITNTRLDQTNTRLESCECQYAELTGFSKNVKDCQMHCDKLEEHTVSLMESTRALEEHMQHSGNNSSEDLLVVKARVNDLHGIFDAHQSGIKDLIADEARAREIHHGAVHDRFDALDDRHKDLENLTQALAKNMARELKSSRDDIEHVHGVMLTVQQAWGMKTKGLRNKKLHDNQRQPLSLLPAGFLTP